VEEDPLADLLAAYAAGRESAFEELVDQAGGRLYAFLERLLGDVYLAEDVYQTVLFRVALRAETFDRRARFMTWLYRIARNAAIDALRRQANTTALSADERADSGPSPDAACEEADERDILERKVREALARLPEAQREAFLLKEEAGLSFEAIGDLVGCGSETAKSRYRYALERLRTALRPEARQYGSGGEP